MTHDHAVAVERNNHPGQRRWPTSGTPQADPKITSGRRGSVPGGAWSGAGLGWRCRACGAGGQAAGSRGDVIAEGFELADVGSFLAFAVDAFVVEVWSEVDEVGVGLREQMPDDDQHGSTDGHDGCVLTAASGDAPVAFAEEGIGPAGDDGGLTEDFGQVPVAVPGGAVALALARGLLGGGGELRPGAQVSRGGEP